MTNKEILQADLLDILFENRNKAYGAYALRKNYNHRLQRSLGISLSVTLLILIFGFSRTRSTDNRIFNDKSGLKLSIVEIPKEPRDPEQIKPKEKPVAETKFTDQVKLVSNNIKPDMPDQNEINNSLISDKTVKGDIPDETATISDKTENENNKTSAENNEKITVFSHSDAQFPGGREAFTEFLKKYLNTPEELEVGEKKAVLVRFMVDVDGTISKTEIVQSGGDKYDREVIRVLHKMPKWVPAMQNGIKVSTYFTQSVTFIGIEE